LSGLRSLLTGWRLVGVGLIVMGAAGVASAVLGWYPA
jgi:hypothetical protein